MRFRQIEDQRGVWPVRVMCDALSVSRSGYYAWRSRPQSPRKIANRELLGDIQRVHAHHRERYGAPRIHAELRAEGQTVSRKRIERMMRQHGIRARAPRRYRVCTTDSKHSLPVAPNLLDQNFVADRPNQVWLADITYIATGEGWLYLAVILDLFTRKVVGWAMRDHMRAELTIAALTMAIQRRRPGVGLVHHSDRGSQGGFKRSSQHNVLAHRRYWSKASAGVFHPRAFRGLELRVIATAAMSSALCALRSVPFGKYWRSRPLVFSFVPRCHGLRGSQK